MSEVINFFQYYEKHNKLDGCLSYNHSLAKSSWLGVGGQAEVFYLCENNEQLIDILNELPSKFKRTIIGQGSNLLIRDGGIKGLVIKLGKKYQCIGLEDKALTIGAAALDKVVARFCEKNSIGGLEFLSGIPGNIGGAVAMNAGCFGGEINDVFISAEGIDYLGNVCNINKSVSLFEYRKNNNADNIIFTKIKLNAINKKQDLIKEKMDEINDKRSLAQPKGIRTGGSTFKNPDSKITLMKAWELIQKTESHKILFDGVSFSAKHSNFIENRQTNSANRIEDFCNLVKNNILDKLGIELDLEIKILGER
jgi:UDP-N-acetylmuramate dehydrogenase|tara:strand:- start:9233 stop:10159 length:927 start_codon:yes stop_codon:yes gene_type:complete